MQCITTAEEKHLAEQTDGEGESEATSKAAGAHISLAAG